MADLTSRQVRDTPAEHPSRVQQADARIIVMKPDTKIAGRKAGGTYVVDSSLAHHYVEVIKVAEYAKDTGTEGSKREKDEPPAVTDRAISSPPRGPKR